jgi:hypothetical protein
VQIFVDVTFSFWYCSNSRCGLRQPSSPPNSKCPLCRTKSNWQRMQSSRSMVSLLSIVPTYSTKNVLVIKPQLNHSSEVEIEQTPVRQIDGHEKYENTEIYRNILHLCRYKWVFLNNKIFGISELVTSTFWMILSHIPIILLGLCQCLKRKI